MRGAPSSELSEAVSAVRPHLRAAAWFSVLSAVLVLAPSAYMLEVYDRAVNSRNPLTLLMLTIAVLGAFAVMELLEWTRMRLLHEAGLVLDRRLGERIFTAMFTANLRRLPGGTPQALHDLRTLREFLTSPPMLAAMEVPAASVFLVVSFAIHPLLGVASLAGALLQLLIARGNELATRSPVLAGNHASLAAQRYAHGAERNAQAIAAMGMDSSVLRRWMATQQEALQQQGVASARAATYTALSRFLQVTMGSLLLGLGAWLAVRNALSYSAGMILIGSIIGVRVLAPLVVLVSQWRSVLQARDALGRTRDLLAAVAAPPAGMPLPAPRGSLRAEYVSASAPGHAQPLLHNVAFALEPGEMLAVVGPSGAGKTCLARVLVGLWACSSGKVRLDGADVFGWDKEQLGPFVGYLPQEVGLFEGTLADNIARFGARDAAALEAAAGAVGLHESILALPQQYETRVGADGAFLSGGMRQRVALARALYGAPVLVVLDEPNASLDDAGDFALAAAIQSWKERGTTFVVVTQRTGVLRLADKVLALNGGRVQAVGPRDEVLAALTQAAGPRAPAAARGRVTAPATATSG
jgi:ATP-binding cassette, subfamily C, bacterial exporter for protease/lipase